MRHIGVAFLMISLLAVPLTAGAVSLLVDASFNFRVVRTGDGQPITSCNPIWMGVSDTYSGSYTYVGTYGNGDSRDVEAYLWYKFTPLNCPGYEFDHWSVRKTSYDGEDYGLGSGSYEAAVGSESPHASARLSDVVVSGDNLYVYMSGGEHAQVTLSLRRSGYKLKVSVEPTSSGEVSPYGVGTHVVPSGSKVSLTPRPNAGWSFDHWTLDGGLVTSRILRFDMNEDHEVTAHFTKEERRIQRVPTSSPAPEACETYPDGWPYSARYRGYTEDMEYNSDLLGNLSGKAKYWQKDNVLLVGWMAIRPQPWSKYGVRIMEDSIVVNGTRLGAGEGKDYGVVFVECREDHTTRVAGITKIGTRAALTWLLENQWEMRGKIIVVLEWLDSNHNGLVEGPEIKIVFELP